MRLHLNRASINGQSGIGRILQDFQKKLSKIKFYRLHHKYVDTNADPYSSRRGLFFSHIGDLH